MYLRGVRQAMSTRACPTNHLALERRLTAAEEGIGPGHGERMAAIAATSLGLLRPG